jgi:Ca2+-transporting ATPase
VIEGDYLDTVLARDGADSLSDVDVIARAVPAQKLGIVEALQRAGEIVAVTGDGVNDVPALQRADVGIAMGERGTRTAREVAAIVLLDDNLRTIVQAIAEGRQLLRNLRLSFAYLLTVHIPLVLTAALIPFAGFPLLYLPAHIVWLELIIHPTALLAFQQAAPSGVLEVADRRAGTRFFGRREWLVIAIVGTLLTLAVIAGYLRGLGPDQDVAHARSIALAILVVASGTVTVGLCRMRGRLALGLSAAAVASAFLMIQVEPIARLMHMSPLHSQDWLLALGSGLAAGALSTLFVTSREAPSAPESAQRAVSCPRRLP